MTLRSFSPGGSSFSCCPCPLVFLSPPRWPTATPPPPPPPPAAPSPATGTKTEQSAPAATDKAPEIKVGPDEGVITLKGFCADASQQGDACKTVITRAQFEKLAETLQPGRSPAIRRQLAPAYPRMLKMSAAAERH